MAFTAGIKKPQQTGGSYNQQSSSDRFVTVTGYDLQESVMLAEDNKTGKKYRIFVSPDEVIRTDAAILEKGTDIGKINWMGHKINQGMERSIKVNHKCVLTRSKVVGSDKTTGVTDLEVHKINALPSQKIDKSFQGIISITYRVDDGAKRIARLLRWHETGVDMTSDLGGLKPLAEMIDEAGKDYGAKIGESTVTKPTVGVQFRALMKTDRTYKFAKDGEPNQIWDVVDTSQPFDWIPGVLGDDGKEMKTAAHPLKGDEMMAYAEMYYNYISENPQFKDHLEDMRFEATYFQSYPATKSEGLMITKGDPVRDKNADKNPLYQLAHRQCYGDIANSPDGLIVGKNAAVNGIVALSDNKVVESNTEDFIVPAYWVSKVFANNIRGHVHAFVRSSDGAKCEPVVELQLLKTENYNKTAKEEDRNEPARAQVDETTSEVAKANKEKPAEVPFNPFGDDADTHPTKLGFGGKR